MEPVGGGGRSVLIKQKVLSINAPASTARNFEKIGKQVGCHENVTVYAKATGMFRSTSRAYIDVCAINVQERDCCTHPSQR
jgi:hypothetical protein